MCGVLRNATPTKTQVSSARSPGLAGWIAKFKNRFFKNHAFSWWALKKPLPPDALGAQHRQRLRSKSPRGMPILGSG